MEKNQEGEAGGTKLSGERSEVPAGETAESNLTETRDLAEQIASENSVLTRILLRYL